MDDEQDQEKRNRGAGLTWWVRYAFVPVAVALIAGFSAVRAADLLKPIPTMPPAATEASTPNSSIVPTPTETVPQAVTLPAPTSPLPTPAPTAITTATAAPTETSAEPAPTAIPTLPNEAPGLGGNPRQTHRAARRNTVLHRARVRRSAAGDRTGQQPGEPGLAASGPGAGYPRRRMAERTGRFGLQDAVRLTLCRESSQYTASLSSTAESQAASP